MSRPWKGREQEPVEFLWLRITFKAAIDQGNSGAPHKKDYALVVELKAKPGVFVAMVHNSVVAARRMSATTLNMP